MGRLRASANRGVSSISLIHPEAIYDIDFANGQWFGALPSDLVVSRASEALTLTAGGTYANFASNTARITANGLLIEEARTNLSRNSSGDGFATGVGASVPEWIFNTSGLNREIVGQETRNGIRGLLVRFNGTPSSTGAQTIVFADANTANIGETYTNSVFVQLAAGLLGTSTGWNFRAGNEAGGTSFTPNGTFQRISNTRTLTATDERGTIRYNFSDTTTPVDFTLFIGGAQCSLAGFSLSPIMTVANAATRPADVVYLPVSGVGAEYTVYVETPITPSHVSNNTVLELWADDNNRSRIAATQVGLYPVTVVSGTQTVFVDIAVSPSAVRKCAMRIKSANSVIAANGSASTVYTGSVPSAAPSRLYLGSFRGLFQFYNHTLTRIAIIPRALSDAELQTLTT